MKCSLRLLLVRQSSVALRKEKAKGQRKTWKKNRGQGHQKGQPTLPHHYQQRNEPLPTAQQRRKGAAPNNQKVGVKPTGTTATTTATNRTLQVEVATPVTYLEFAKQSFPRVVCKLRDGVVTSKRAQAATKRVSRLWKRQKNSVGYVKERSDYNIFFSAMYPQAPGATKKEQLQHVIESWNALQPTPAEFKAFYAKEFRRTTGTFAERSRKVSAKWKVFKAKKRAAAMAAVADNKKVLRKKEGPCNLMRREKKRRS